MASRPARELGIALIVQGSISFIDIEDSIIELLCMALISKAFSS
jgi:hypothetical protein